MSFIFGGNTGLSYDELQRRRREIDGRRNRFSAPRNIGEGLTALGIALNQRLEQGRLNSQIKAGQKRGDKAFSAFQSILSGGASPGGQHRAPSSSVSISGSIPASETGTTMAGGHGLPESNSSGGWLRYANDGAIRNKPLSGDLVNALSFLPELGVTMEVFSGGQDAKGKGTRRTGSTRHDHGNAADVFFYKDGRKLDWANADDLPIFEEIVSRGRAAGLTGFGAGLGYMRPGSMHIGFGNEAVWGAGGRGVNAPAWLSAAYNAPARSPGRQVATLDPAAGVAPSVPTTATSTSPQLEPQRSQPRTTVAQTAPNGGIDSRLFELMASPDLSPGQRAVMTLMYRDYMARNAPMTPLQQVQLEKSRAELDRLRNPERKIIKGADGFNYYQDTGERVLPGVETPNQQNRVLADHAASALGLDPEKGYIVGQAGKVSYLGRNGATVTGNTVSGFKVPDHYMPDPKDPNRVIPIPNGPADPNTPTTAILDDARRVNNAANALQQALDQYEKLLEKYGTEIWPGKGQDALMSARRNFQLQAKELYNLGALNGPDLDIMDQLMVDPTGIGTAFMDVWPESLGGSDFKTRAKANVQQLRDQFEVLRKSQTPEGFNTGPPQSADDASVDDLLKQYGGP